MYLAFNAPHDPRQSPKEYVDKYPVEDVELPKSFAGEYPYKDSIGCSKKLRDEKLAPFPRTEYSIKVHRQEYYAIITHMDAQVGRILDALDKQGMADNTYVFFTSDHGLAVGSHGLVGKQNMYDHSMRVPLMVTGPGVEKNKRIDTPVYLQDIMPTTLELAGVQKPEQVQFNSLLSAIRGESFKPYDAIYGGYKDLQRMISKDGYKLILYPEIGKARLYNLTKDPLEMNDLAGKKKYRKLMKSLLKDLIKLQKQTCDPMDLHEIYSDLLS
jgi:choline-sulfatase